MAQFAAVPEMVAAVELRWCGRGGPDLAELLGRCSVLIEEVGAEDGRPVLTEAERASVPAGCAVITVPQCRLVSLWPMMTQDARRLPDGGSVPFAMGDRLAVLAVQNEPDAALRRRRYFTADLPSLVDLAGLHEMEARDCFAREQGCDVRVAAYVLGCFANIRLFHTYERPTSELVYFVLAQLYGMASIRGLTSLSYRELVGRARDWADQTAFAAEEQAPVHPAVAAWFGLRWCPPDLRYATVGGWRTHGEWMDFYLSDLAAAAVPAVDVAARADGASRFDVLAAAGDETVVVWPEAIAGGDSALALARRQAGMVVAEIAAATGVRRVEPFAAIDGSGVPSSHGHLFTDPASRRYDLAPALVVGLRGGVVLGAQGLVLAGDRILGDSLRSLHAGPGAAMLARAGPDGIVLKPGQPARTRALPGPSFCGFGPAWGDLSHWLLASLPRLVAYAQLRRRFPELRLVLPALPDNSVHTETLALLSIGADDIAVVGADEALVCEELMATTAFDLWSVSPFCHHAAQFLTRHLPPPRGDATTFRRIFLRPRAVPGRLSNFDAIAPLLERHGFACVFIEDLSLRQRIAIMRQARIVVAEHGPPLAHILFARAGAMVLELVAPGGLQPMFWSLASVTGLQHGTLVGDGDGDGGFSVAPDVLSGVLDQLLRAEGSLAEV